MCAAKVVHNAHCAERIGGYHGLAREVHRRCSSVRQRHWRDHECIVDTPPCRCGRACNRSLGGHRGGCCRVARLVGGRGAWENPAQTVAKGRRRADRVLSRHSTAVHRWGHPDRSRRGLCVCAAEHLGDHRDCDRNQRAIHLVACGESPILVPQVDPESSPRAQ